jgi:uncharacterized protein (DUF2141 family)
MALIKTATTSVIRLIRVPFFLFPFTLLISACAQMLVPSGGAEDETPPKVTHYMPDSAAVNFKGTEINIAFNEYIQLKDINNQLIISPLLDEMPEIKLLRNKIVNISFKKPLKENTTYTLNFGSSIADYNEGNVLEGFRYIFSTGSFIDSLSVSGKVDHAFNHKTEKGILVMLYEDQSDSVPYKLLPSYFTKTKADGSFIITNMRPGKYKVFALKDENKNYKYDAESEFIAFTDTLAEAGSKKQLLLHLFKEVPKKLKVLNAKAEEYGHINVVFNKPVLNLKVKTLNVVKVPIEIIRLGKTMDTLDYWFEGIEADSLKLELKENEHPFDTISIRLITKEMMKKTAKGGKSTFAASLNIPHGQKLERRKTPFIISNHPFKISDSSAILPVNSLLFGYPDRFMFSHFLYRPGKFSDDSDHDPYFKDDTTYKYILLPGALTDIFGNKNDTIRVHIQTLESKSYGTLKIRVKFQKGGTYRLQLLDSKETVVEDENLVIRDDLINDQATVDYVYLVPGSYKFKLIYDTNNNGKWDPGDYLGKKQPEKVIYYDQPITIRSNWDLEIEWKVAE